MTAPPSLLLPSFRTGVAAGAAAPHPLLPTLHIGYGFI